MEASVRLREKRWVMAKKKAIRAKKAEEDCIAAGLPPKRQTQRMAEISSDSEPDEDRPGAAHKGDHDPARPRWTRIHPSEDLMGCSVYTHFLQYAWAHRPEALLEQDFWPAVQAEARSFNEQDGWWPHILWQALFGEWCGATAVVHHSEYGLPNGNNAQTHPHSRGVYSSKCALSFGSVLVYRGAPDGTPDTKCFSDRFGRLSAQWCDDTPC